MPTLVAIDERLAALRTAETTITANLVALDEHPAYKLLSAAKDSLSGVTATRARPALQAMRELWQHFTLLSDLVDRADEVRGTDKRLSDAELEQLDELLHGHSVPLPRRQVPLAQQSLLASSHVQEAITPDDLLAAMTNAFEQARDVVAAADEAWNELLPALDAATQEIDALAGRASELDLAEPRSLAMARAALTPLATRIAHDPLGAHAELDATTKGHLATARAEIDSIAADRDELRASLPAARALLDRIRGLRERGERALATSRAKVANAEGLLAAFPEDQLDDTDRGLAAWIGRIENLAARREWRLGARGLRQWRATAEDLEALAEQIVDANEGPVRRRDELRGLLTASKAKAAAVGVGEDDTIDDIYNAAHGTLHTTPCDLAKAEALVTEHLTAVRALLAPRTREERS